MMVEDRTVPTKGSGMTVYALNNLTHMDGLVTRHILSVDTSNNDTEWRCDGCGRFVHPYNENAEAHIYLAT